MQKSKSRPTPLCINVRFGRGWTSSWRRVMCSGAPGAQVAQHFGSEALIRGISLERV
jgi:hypothetical protein